MNQLDVSPIVPPSTLVSTLDRLAAHMATVAAGALAAKAGLDKDGATQLTTALSALAIFAVGWGYNEFKSWMRRRNANDRVLMAAQLPDPTAADVKALQSKS